MRPSRLCRRSRFRALSSEGPKAEIALVESELERERRRLGSYEAEVRRKLEKVQRLMGKPEA